MVKVVLWIDHSVFKSFFLYSKVCRKMLILFITLFCFFVWCSIIWQLYRMILTIILFVKGVMKTSTCRKVQWSTTRAWKVQWSMSTIDFYIDVIIDYFCLCTDAGYVHRIQDWISQNAVITPVRCRHINMLHFL